jgi:hypothetical protein
VNTHKARQDAWKDTYAWPVWEQLYRLSSLPLGVTDMPGWEVLMATLCHPQKAASPKIASPLTKKSTSFE